MELFNEEGGKLRKKDKMTFYKDDAGKLHRVPKMTDNKDIVFPYLRMCALRTIPGVTDDMINEVWAEAEGKLATIIEGLEQMKGEAEASGENTWKVIAYVKAIKRIKTLTVPILSGEQAQKLDDIGPGIASVINEILRHGRIKTFEERVEGTTKRQAVMDIFLPIWGVTAKIAGLWYAKGYKTIEDLEAGSSTPRSSTKSPRSPLKLTDKQKLGIKYYEDFNKKIPREEVNAIVNEISNTIDDAGVAVIGVGPYRSGEENVDEIEILIKGLSGKAALKKIVTTLSKKGLFQIVNPDLGTLDAKKFVGACAYAGTRHKITIYLLPEDDVGIFLLFSTGPKNFIANIKEQAAILNYRLDAKGLVKLSMDNDEFINTPTEEDIFKELSMTYVEPWDRK